MPPIGETLREARMRQRLDIADVEARTKIRAKYLRALENEEWALLPGPTFVKTFLRTYAEVVGVDPYLLVEEYRVNHEPADEQELQPLGSLPPRDTRRGSRRPPPRRRPGRGLAIGGVVAAVLVFLLLLGSLGGDDDGGGDGDATTATQTTESRRAPRKDPTAVPPAEPTGARVRIVPIEPTYVCVDTGPGTATIYENTLDAARTFRNPRLVRINLGKRSATVAANGEPVAVSDSPEPLGLAVTPKGARELDAGERPCA
jgi:transcriptional regulator with XRE-family HTH domain